MLLGQFKVCLLSDKTVSKIWKFIHFSDCSLVSEAMFGRCEKTEFEVCLSARNLNVERKSIILQSKNFLRRLPIHRFVEFSRNIGCNMVETISLKMRNLGFELFFESGFRLVIIILNDHATSQKLSISTKL